MADRVTTGLYTFDPHGINPDNLITNERQTLQTPGLDDYFFIIPHAAPFFVDSLKLYNHQTNALYVEGTDYLVGHYFVEAMQSTGRPIAGSIRLLRRDISGIVRLEYRTLGGQWGFNDNAILEELSNRQFNPLIRSWGMISNLPATFPPLPHDQSVDDLVGSEDLLGGLDDIRSAIESAAAGSTDQHVNDFNNPHRVTKAQVGLDKVDNYSVATQEAAETGTSNAEFMTPLRTAQAVAVQATAPLTAHVNREDNPHAVTKAQVGLGDVPNYPVADETEATDPSRNDRFMTPYTVALLLQSGGDSARIDAIETQLYEHTANTNNPHQVTAEQVGAYTKADVDLIIESFQAEDTLRFAGLTDAEWRASLPSFDDLQVTIEKIQSEYGHAQGVIAGVDASVAPPPAPLAVQDIYAGAGAYVMVISDGTAVEVPSPGVLGTLTDTTVEQFSIRPDAAYFLTTDGYVTAVGSAVVTTPTAYSAAGGVPPTDRPVAIYAHPAFVYLLLEGGDVIKYTDTTVTTVASGVAALYSSMFGPERTILQREDGTAWAIGESGYDTAMSAELSALTGIQAAVIGDDETYVHFTDGRLRGWTQTLDGGTYVMDTIVLPIDQANDISSVSGRSTHFAILRTDGTAAFRGDNSAGQCGVNPMHGPFREVVAGPGYTVTLGENGVVLFWGTDDDNMLLPPAIA